MTITAVPVSKRALLQRINRALAKEEEMVKTLRGDRWLHDLGRYYRLDLNRNVIMEKHVDLEETGRQLGVLAKYERVEE